MDNYNYNNCSIIDTLGIVYNHEMAQIALLLHY